MPACPNCTADVPSGARFCPSCGARAAGATRADLAVTAEVIGATTALPASLGATRAPTPPRSSRGADRPPSSPTVRFEPGAIIAGRYRLVSLLGRGGMGEVYRADDLTLDQAVALKFLPESVAGDAARLAQFHGELRLARQVSHKNVCRLYDLGEGDGRPFITMEYVDGEDLASLVRRIGRVPEDKAVELARQLCAGLAAAHEKGVLHRDLKPANVMIDGNGNVRLTDFGLATADGQADAVRAGTPQYMAPEQLAGEGASIRSDIYALGLVLFEIFTGRRAWDAKSLQELRALQDSGAVTTPSSVVRDLDPAIERAILRCLERDPQRRPGSALAVAAALPGGDPVAAALAAGETPSPEMLIAAGESEAVPVGRALAWAVLAFAAIGAFAAASVRASIPALVPLDKPPEVLIDRVEQMTTAFGYDNSSADRAFGFMVPPDYPAWARRTSTQPNWWNTFRNGSPPALVFWYRTSPRPMAPLRPVASVSPTDPPLDVSGMRSLITDTRGRLVEFHASPPQFDAGTSPAPPPNWQPLFDAAGLDLKAFNPVAPQWTPRDFADARAAWEGPLVDRPDVTVRVEAASYRGKPTSFYIVGPWTRPNRMEPLRQTTMQLVSGILDLVVWNAALIVAILLARRNLRANRADRKGANALTLVLFFGFLVGWLFAAHHTPAPDVELNRFLTAVGLILLQVGEVWVFYLAIEPYARRFWPDGLLGWTRLMSGRVRDPRVGHDVLVGALIGAAMLLTELARALVPPLLGAKAAVPPFGDAVNLLARSSTLPLSLTQVTYNALESALFVAFLLIGLRLLLRRTWLAIVVGVVIITAISDNGAFINGGWVEAGFGLLIIVILTLIVLRFGLLTTSVALLVDNTMTSVPLSHAPSVWWAFAGDIGVALVVALVCFGFYAARTGQPLFGAIAGDA